MKWTYTITAESRPRLLMRVAQVFDQQSLLMRSLQLTQSSDHAVLHITIEAPELLARRIHAKLYHHTDIREIKLFGS